jgi:hypothetical protein
MGKEFLAAPAGQTSQENPPSTDIFQGYSGFLPSENSDRGVKLAIYAYKLPELRVQLHRPPLIRFHVLSREFRTIL